jgi:hypothetical protein
VKAWWADAEGGRAREERPAVGEQFGRVVESTADVVGHGAVVPTPTDV